MPPAQRKPAIQKSKKKNQAQQYRFLRVPFHRHERARGMSALDQKQTCAAPLFDHLVSASDECVRDVDSERLGSLEVDVKLDLGCQLDRQARRLLPLRMRPM
jgi:hypothetical protein